MINTDSSTEDGISLVFSVLSFSFVYLERHSFKKLNKCFLFYSSFTTNSNKGKNNQHCKLIPLNLFLRAAVDQVWPSPGWDAGASDRFAFFLSPGVTFFSGRGSVLFFHVSGLSKEVKEVSKRPGSLTKTTPSHCQNLSLNYNKSVS